MHFVKVAFCSFSYLHPRLAEVYVSITVLLIKNEKLHFFGLGFILYKAVQKKYFALKYFPEVQVVTIRNKPFIDQSNVAYFYL